MWKKTFIRLAFVMVVASMGMLVFAAASRKVAVKDTDCAKVQEKCAGKDDKSQGDFLIWESLSRMVSTSVPF